MMLAMATCFSLLALLLVAQGKLTRSVFSQPSNGGIKKDSWRDGSHSPKLWTAPRQSGPTSHRSQAGASSGNEISVNLTVSPFEVSPQFLSVTLDAVALNYSWDHTINFSLSRVVNLAKGLAPAMLRVGGTYEDLTVFGDDQQHWKDRRHAVEGNGHPTLTNFRHPQLAPKLAVGTCRSNYSYLVCMNTSQWDAVNLFAEAVGWDFVFGLNLLLGYLVHNGAWDSSNAEELMDYTLSKGYRVNWELGNEPDLFPRFLNLTVSPEQDAKDYSTLRALVVEKSPNSQYVAGPDIAFMNYDYFGRFLESVEDGAINAATWHTYYKIASSAVLPDFFNATLLDKTIREAITARRFVDQYQPDIELWLGETSSCSHGGAPVFSPAYVAGFMWLDKLGIAAATNHSRVFRQSFVGNFYSLLDSSFNPRPDYWLSLLHKRLVGTRVLLVDNGLQPERHVRVYAHCAKSPYPSGSVVLLLLNVNTYDTNATLLNLDLTTSDRDVYWLTPPGGTANITSSEVTLNGKLLQLEGDKLPSLSPQEETASDTVFLPALSFGFFVFKDAKAAACT